MKTESLTCGRASCGMPAVGTLCYPGYAGKAFCATDGLHAMNTLTQAGVNARFEALYEAPKLELVGQVSADLVKDRAEAVSIFREIQRHAEHVVGGIIPGVVLHDAFKRMGLFLDRVEGKPKPPAPTNPSQNGGMVVPGFAHCAHGVPDFVTCAACKAEQDAMREAEKDLIVSILPTGDTVKP